MPTKSAALAILTLATAACGPPEVSDSDTGDCELVTAYRDGDGDGWGDVSEQVCGTLSSGFVLQGGDCDDEAADRNLGAKEAPATAVDEDCDGLVDEVEGWPGQTFAMSVASDPGTRGQHVLFLYGEGSYQGRAVPWEHETDPLYFGPTGTLYGIIPLAPSALTDAGWEYATTALTWELRDSDQVVVDSGVLEVLPFPEVHEDPVQRSLDIIDSIRSEVVHDDHFEMLEALDQLIEAGRSGPTVLLDVDGTPVSFGPDDLTPFSLAFVHATDSALALNGESAELLGSLVQISDHLASVYAGGAALALVSTAMGSDATAASVAPAVSPYTLAFVSLKTVSHIAGTIVAHDDWTLRPKVAIGLLRVTLESATVGPIAFREDYARLLLHSKALTCVSPFGECQLAGEYHVRSASWACGMEWQDKMPEGCTLIDTTTASKRLECECKP